MGRIVVSKNHMLVLNYQELRIYSENSDSTFIIILHFHNKMVYLIHW